jgi:hypothetical protein
MRGGDGEIRNGLLLLSSDSISMRIGVQDHVQVVELHWLHLFAAAGSTFLLSLHNKESHSLSSMVFAIPVERGFAVR